MEGSMETKEYTITVFTENQTGVLSRVVATFTRRYINIVSLTTSQSSAPDIHRFTIVINVTKDVVEKLVKQLEKQIDILKAFYYENDEIVYQEIALYKVPMNAFVGSSVVEKIIRKHFARVLYIEKDYVVIEKTGHEYENGALLEELRAYNIYEFVRSGRVAIVKPMERLNNYLKQLEEEEKMATL